MRLERLGLFVAALLLTATSALAQTNPCTAPAPSGVNLSPSKFYVTLPEQTTLELDGVTPRVTDYQVAHFAQGANPATATPVVGPIAVPKNAFALVAGTTDCYLMTPIQPPVPVGGSAPLVTAIKSRRAASATVAAAESAWSVISNPFGLAPSVLATPGPAAVR